MSEPTRADEMREQCAAYHKAHPEVWDLFVKLTMNRIAKGFTHYGVGAIFGQMRWEMASPTADAAQFKVNNNFHAFYARRFHRMYPQHDGFFRTRVQKSADQDATNLPPLGPVDFDGVCPHCNGGGCRQCDFYGKRK